MHHPIAISAMRKGKHVLTEKLMAHDTALCKEMCRVAADKSVKATNGKPIVLAVGHQRHYSILYDNAVEQIRKGLMGNIHHIRAKGQGPNMPQHDSWQPPLPGDPQLAKDLKKWQNILAGKDKDFEKPKDATEIAE